MNPLTSKIDNLTSSALFQEFVSKYSFEVAVEKNYKITLKNECYYCELYMEYRFPFFHIFSMNYNTYTSRQIIMDFDNKEVRAFDRNFTDSLHDCEDIIENREALVLLYRCFKLILTFYPDFFSCSSYEKYKNKFYPKEISTYWPESFDLPKKKKDNEGFDFLGMIKKVF